MRFLALLGNIVLLGVVVYALFTEGMPDGSEVLIVAFLSLLPIVNIYAICSSSGQDWISLWLKRKALEEKKKIEKLSD